MESGISVYIKRQQATAPLSGDIHMPSCQRVQATALLSCDLHAISACKSQPLMPSPQR